MKSKHNRRSLQDIRKLRQRETFVGREKQEELYQYNFSLGEEQRAYIFTISGIGGVGKSSLLTRFEQAAKSNGAITAWNDETQKDVLSVMENFAKQFEKQDHEFKKFSKSHQYYLQKCHELVTDPNAPSGLADFIGGLTKAGIRFGQTTPANLLLGFVDVDTLSKGAGNLTNTLVAHLKRKLSDEEVRLVQSPIDELTPLFIEDLWDVSQERFIALFFDTFEYTGGYLEDWLIKCLDGHYGDLPPNIVLSIAGQSELDKNKWKVHEGLLCRFPLDPFTEEEALKYLSRQGVVNENVIRVILNLSKRLPLLVATLAAGHPDELSQIGDLNDTALDCFLKWVKDPDQRRLLLNAALARTVNRDVLAVLIGEEEAAASFDWFQQMPFVKKSLTGWVYHDVVRPHLLHRKRVETPHEWSSLHARLASFYKKSKDELQLTDAQKMTNDAWQELACEEAYHLLCAFPQKCLPVVLDDFIAALTFSSFAHQWAEMMQQAGEDCGDILIAHWGELLITGLNDREKKPCEKWIAMLNELLNHHEINLSPRFNLLQLRASAYLNAELHEQALIDLEQLTQIQPDNAWYCFLKAVTLLRVGRQEELSHALKHLDEVDPSFMPNLVKQYIEQSEALGRGDELIKNLRSEFDELDQPGLLPESNNQKLSVAVTKLSVEVTNLSGN